MKEYVRKVKEDIQQLTNMRCNDISRQRERDYIALERNLIMNVYVPKAWLSEFTLNGTEYKDPSALSENISLLFMKLSVSQSHSNTAVLPTSPSMCEEK